MLWQSSLPPRHQFRISEERLLLGMLKLLANPCHPSNVIDSFHVRSRCFNDLLTINASPRQVMPSSSILSDEINLPLEESCEAPRVRFSMAHVGLFNRFAIAVPSILPILFYLGNIFLVEWIFHAASHITPWNPLWCKTSLQNQCTAIYHSRTLATLILVFA